MRRKIALLAGGILKRDAGTHASSIAFFFFMALIPLLILMASVLPLLGVDAGDVNSFFQQLFPGDSDGLVYAVIREAFDHSTAAFSVSAILLLWTSSRGVTALIKGLNAMYDQKEQRRFQRVTLVSLGYTVALMAFMVSVIYLIFSGRLLSLMRTMFPGIRLPSETRTFLEFQLMLLIGIGFFCLVFCFLPSGRRGFLRQFPGAFITSAGWTLFSMLFRVYVNVFNSFARFYGSLATVIVLLFWLFWVFYILLAGAFVNAHLAEIVPGRFLAFFQEKRGAGMVVCGLFLAGFVAFLSDCFLSWQLYRITRIRYLMMLLRFVTLASWLAATMIAARQMRSRIPKRYTALLIAAVLADLVLMRRGLIENPFVYLMMFFMLNLGILCLCAQVVFSKEKREG